MLEQAEEQLATLAGGQPTPNARRLGTLESEGQAVILDGTDLTHALGRLDGHRIFGKGEEDRVVEATAFGQVAPVGILDGAVSP